MAFPIDVNYFDQNGEFDDVAAERSHKAVVDLFEQTPEFKALPRSVGATYLLLHFASDYLGEPLTGISIFDINEILFNLFPEKTMIDSEDAPVVIAELRAFWTWLDREFSMPNARACLEWLDDETTDVLTESLADESSFGMGKQLLTLGKEAGFDMTSESGLQAFMQHFNNTIAKSGPFGAMPPRSVGPAGAGANDIGDVIPPRETRDERRKKHKQQRAAKKRNRR